MRTKTLFYITMSVLFMVGCSDDEKSNNGNVNNVNNINNINNVNNVNNTNNANNATEFVVVSAMPENGATDVPVDTSIVFEMNLEVDTSTLVYTGDESGTFELSLGEDFVPGDVSASGNTITFVPSANLEHDTVYSAWVKSGVKSTSGLEADATRRYFTTAADSNAVGPSLVQSTPAADATDISIDPEITLEFSGEVDGDTINSQTLKIVSLGFHGPDDNAEVPYSRTVAGNTITVRPDTLQEYQTTYRVRITDGALGVNGLPLQMDEWRFTTVQFDPGYRYEIHSANSDAIGFSGSQNAFSVGSNPVAFQIATNSEGYYYFSHTATSMELPSNEEFMSTSGLDSPVDYTGTDQNGYPFSSSLWFLDSAGGNTPDVLGESTSRYRIRNLQHDPKVLTGESSGGFTLLFPRDESSTAVHQRWLFLRGDAL